MTEGVAVVFTQRALGCGSDMGEYKLGGGLGGYSMQVGTVPGRDGRREQARGLPELGVGVKADSEAVGIILSSASVL